MTDRIQNHTASAEASPTSGGGPEILRSASDMLRWSRARRREGAAIGFVPTMGALHEGHASLLRRARPRCDRLVLSIYVNPTQFGPGEDFARYPRTWESDLDLALREGVDAVFAPGESFYPEGYGTVVTLPEWRSVLEGEIRPGHFDGVGSVVTKLFHCVEPDFAVFGQKDAQQALLIRRMVRDLDFPIEIDVAPTVRESDGLAMSSRNRYLSEAERSRAPALHRALSAAGMACAAGERRPSVLLDLARGVLAVDPPDRLDYLAIRSRSTFRDLAQAQMLEEPAILLIAARYGSTRLIDNLELDC